MAIGTVDLNSKTHIGYLDFGRRTKITAKAKNEESTT